MAEGRGQRIAVNTLDVDLTTSTVRIAGRRLPACLLRCPPHERQPEWSTPDDRILGLYRGDRALFVPCESGVLVEVTPDDDSLTLVLVARTCTEDQHPADDTVLWLPEILEPRGRNVVPGYELWRHCEPWWVVEFIDRVSSYAYSEPPGPACELLPLSAGAAVVESGAPGRK